MLTAEILRDALAYNPETGVFTRRKTGRAVGHTLHNAYIRVELYGRQYRAHRLAWLYMTGEWPKGEVDHVDGDGFNNRFSNLRDATTSQNSCNAKPSWKRSSLPRGVSRNAGKNYYRAQISVGGRYKHLGCYTTAEEAHEVYKLAAEMLHGEFAFHKGQGAQKHEQRAD